MTQPRAFGRPPAADTALLGLAVIAVGTSAPLIAATAVPALAISFWRNAMACALLVPLAGRARERPRGPGVRPALLAGALLALHFATWITSVKMTTVATSTALVATQPVWATLAARARGAAVSGAAWAGVLLAVGGAALLTGLDLQVSARAVTGDVLALVGAMFAAGYVVAGEAARRTLTTTGYTAVCYSLCAGLLLVACLVGGVPLSGWSGTDWLRLVGLTAGAQLLGHTVFNRVLRTTSATVVSLAILFEVPGAALLAWLALGQVPGLRLVPALAALLAGVGLVVLGERSATVVPVTPALGD